jgi:hypothetical protein
MAASSCMFLSNFDIKSQPILIRMSDATFLATWDYTGDVGIANLTKAELEEITTGTGSEKGEHVTRY